MPTAPPGQATLTLGPRQAHSQQGPLLQGSGLPRALWELRAGGWPVGRWGGAALSRGAAKAKAQSLGSTWSRRPGTSRGGWAAVWGFSARFYNSELKETKQNNQLNKKEEEAAQG